MSSYSLFSATLKRSLTLQVAVVIAAIALLRRIFLFPPRNGWTEFLANGLPLQKIWYIRQYRRAGSRLIEVVQGQV